MINKRIIELKRQIEEYINAGGDIYAPKRQLPYYEYMSTTVRMIKRKTGKHVSYEDVYQLCGIHFNRDYVHFKKFLTKLTPFVKNGYADAIRSKEVRNTSNVYEMLKNYADKYNTTPFDFLVLMTGFKFKECVVRTNYIENLKLEIRSEYPTGDITGIRWENPRLYEKMRQLKKFLPSLKSTKEVAEYLGFVTRGMQDSNSVNINENEIIEQLTLLYPNKKVVALSTTYPELYQKVLNCSRKAGISSFEWLKLKGFSYASGQSHKRLALTKTDGEKRAEMLLNLKKKALESMTFDKTDSVSLFEASLAASIKVIDQLNKELVKNELSEEQAH